jgi:uncharacterized SAM-binding protein YcdF (DUF218 family)
MKDRMVSFIKFFFLGLGILAFIMLVLSFTDIPYHAYYNLGISSKPLNRNPDVIVILGGSGMPSPDGLIRTYYGADAALKFSSAKIIIAHPKNQFDKDTFYQLNLMRRELKLKGVDTTRILYEPQGFNTRSQAFNTADLVKEKETLSVLIITSPEHMFRAVKTFQKIGFGEVGGEPAFGNDLSEEYIEDDENSDDPRVKTSSLRYNMWSYLQYEIIVLREYMAIAYYYVKGWI